VNLVPSDEAGRLAVAALDVPGRKYLNEAAPVFALDDVLLQGDALFQDRVRLNDFLQQREIIARLIFVVRSREPATVP